MPYLIETLLSVGLTLAVLLAVLIVRAKPSLICCWNQTRHFRFWWRLNLHRWKDDSETNSTNRKWVCERCSHCLHDPDIGYLRRSDGQLIPAICLVCKTKPSDADFKRFGKRVKHFQDMFDVDKDAV